ncbi:MAG: rhomboid family intramembrane serine protease [Sedimentisphaerales bacterium]|nr:rhomboid family intramembrane serine protease [Sedimentisphaerales bacterium]
MLLPIRTNVRPYRTPYANYAIIAVNVVAFFLTYWPHPNPITGTAEILRSGANHLMFTPVRPQLWQFITYAFLHGGLLHIAGNMFFLYLFGNNVNDKLGNFNYICFYLAGGVFSAVGHMLLNNAPVIGASGAVAAVTGAYLVFFPKTLITVVYWFYIIGTMDVPALYFIAFKMIILDNAIIRYTPNVAYDAHLAGYAFGIIASMVLLATGLTPSSHFDLWAMLKQWNRRRRYRDAISTGYDPYTGMGSAKQVKSREVKNSQFLPNNPQIVQIRSDIANSIYQHKTHDAAESYLRLTTLDENQILPRQQLLDIANQLASEGRHEQAASAYEKFLAHYANYEHIEQVELMLGLIYARYLDNPESALKHLSAAENRLTNPDQLALCRTELAKLQNS